MRTIAEFRERQLERLVLGFERPLMSCGGHGKMAENFFSTIIRDLCWLEEREKEHSVVEHSLLHGSQGVYGQFYYQHLSSLDEYLPEVTSIYAQAAFQLGYFNPERLLSEAEYTEMKDHLDTIFFDEDHTLCGLVKRFGEPSQKVFSSATTVHCYGCENRDYDWIYFDYADCHPPGIRNDHHNFNNEILRDVRRRNNIFELLPFSLWGKVE